MTEETKHALLSPSGAHRWMACPGSVAMGEGIPRTDSVYSIEGTDAHELAALSLNTGKGSAAFKGRIMTGGTEVDDEMVSEVGKYVARICQFAEGGVLFVEQRLPISHITGEEGACGTADAVILQGNEIQVHDLKYGKGEQVDAEENPQLMMYALGALERYGISEDFETVRVVIHQPRLNHLSEWSCSVASLVEFGLNVSDCAETALIALELGNWMGESETYLTPGEKQCRWCPAKAKCPALAKFVTDAIGVAFACLDAAKESVKPVDIGREDGGGLAVKMSAVGLIEGWCKAVRAAVEMALFAGDKVLGWKIVQGKRGNRAWSDATEAEATLKAMRLKVDQMYDFKLISPTSAEKLLKETPKRWARVAPLVSQSDGKPSVAPENDPRPALVVMPMADDFETTEEVLT